ncbi:MAG: Inner membrane protein YpjD [Paracidovorax wautersii]|uniref:Inner membrane protein YpjD n=1 Tax=Paracidovorax wautersii TaxID=1177982 RepID=A0A7V8FM99_9BURK|nr:MAG: Inner membrane protein YpjD [Paracidovorax wautersii]
MILEPVSIPGLWLSLGAAIAYVIPALAARHMGTGALRGWLIAAWLLHAGALALGVLAHPPRFGFAPALSMTAWLVLTVYGVESRFYPQLRSRLVLAVLGAFTVLLAAAMPGAPTRLDDSPWLPLHWALGIASYGLFAAAVVHAWLLQRAERQIRQVAQPADGLPLLTLEKLTFRFVQAGFVLLTATLAAGWLFGESLHSSYWKWEHKTVFSVLAWLTFATLLAGRRRFGWRGRTAVRVLYLGAALLLLAYVGSRFVLEVVLHRPFPF